MEELAFNSATTGKARSSSQPPSNTAFQQRQMIESDNRITTLSAALRAAAMQPVHDPGYDSIVLLDSQGHEQRLRYAELWKRALVVAAGMCNCGLQPGDRIILLLPTSETYIITLAAAMLLGVIPCTIAAPTSRTKVAEALRYIGYAYQKLEPVLVVTPPHLTSSVRAYLTIEERRVVQPEDLCATGSLSPNELPTIKPEQPLHIQLTSGTTSRPKGVVLSHTNIIAQVRAIAAAIDYAPRQESALSWLPLYHDMGLTQLLMAFYYQSTLVLMTPTAFLRNPLAWLRNISTYRAAHSAAPTFAYNLCVRKFDPAKLAGVDLSSWRYAFVGAEPVPLNILETFRCCYQAYGFSHQAIYPCYGMAETVLGTTLPRNMPDLPNRRFGFVSVDRILADELRTKGCVTAAHQEPDYAGQSIEIVGTGSPIQGIELCIMSPNDDILPARTVGEICVQGSSLMQGYFHDPDATAAVVRNGWYHTGDRGYLVDGELYILGRIKELLIVRGRNYAPHDIEEVVEEHEQVCQDQSVVFGVYNPEQGTEDVMVIIESKASLEEQRVIARQVQQSLQQAFGFTAHDIAFVRRGSIPRTTSGKRQRVRSREMYLEGAFGVEPVTGR